MQCSRCQADNKGDRRFCASCGAALVVVCAACAFLNETGATFCGGCGAALSAPRTGPPAAAPAAYASPKAYTPAHLAERILGSRGALEGERKQVTVMFADLKGSMELLAERDPEEARQILDPVLECMMDAVHRYQGTVNQVMGDGIMALFGAPVAHEDHAVRAGYAALSMTEALGALAAEQERRLGFRVQIRVGLNSGEVVVRAIGSDLRMDYSAVGQTTHLAARMEQLAGPGSIFVTEAFTRLTEPFLHFKPLGLVAIKGLPESVDVFELVGAEPTRARFQAAASRGLTRFVGRSDELKLLLEALDRAEARAGQVVAVIGEPGVGKSRLFHELVRSSRTSGWLVLETGSVSYGQKTAWMPVAELLRTYFQVDDRADPADIRTQVSARLNALDASLADVLPAVLWLLDVPVEDPAWAVLDPEQRRQATLEGVRRILVWQSRERPLLIVFENLHWIDAETQTFLNRLVDGLRGTRILLLVSYRPEYHHGWASKTYYGQVRLDPLAPASAEELLHTLLGDASDLLPLKTLLIERTQGNPFFLEESVRHPHRDQGRGRPPGRLPPHAPAVEHPRARNRADHARRAHRPPEPGGEETTPVGGGHRPGVLAAPAGGGHGIGGGRSRRRDRAAPGRRVPLRDQPVPGDRVHVQARADAGSRLRQPAAGQAAGAPRPHPRCHRGVLRRPTGQRGRAPRPPRLPGRGVGQSRDLPASGGSQGAGSLREP